MSNPSGVLGAAPPPPGVIPNFVNPPSTGYRLVVSSIVTWVSATVFVALRAYVKLRILQKITSDDCMYGFALFGIWIICIQ